MAHLRQRIQQMNAATTSQDATSPLVRVRFGLPLERTTVA